MRVAAAVAALLVWSCSEAPMSAGGEMIAREAQAPQDLVAQEKRAGQSDTDIAGFFANTDGTALGNASSADKDTAPQERKQIYTANNEIEVADIESTKDKIRDYVLGLGGMVDTIGDNYVSVRVPYQKFDEAVKWTLELGRVIQNNISNYDVSDYYADVDARLALARQTRTRLNQLLQNTTDVEARVEILREIRRLSEEIDALEQTLRIIDDAVAYSTISISMRQIAASSQQREETAFPWIAALSPSSQSVRDSWETLDVDLGAGFARIGTGRLFYAESADGIQVRIGSVSNNPKGDTAFWAKALRHYLTPRYAKTEDISLGGKLSGLRLTSFDMVPYVYEILAQVRGDNILVVEVYYPSLEHFSAQGVKVAETLRAAAERSGR